MERDHVEGNPSSNTWKAESVTGSTASPQYLAALQVVQEALAALASWTGTDGFKILEEESAVTKAKEILSWPDITNNKNIGSLRFLFDSVGLSNRKDQNRQHYSPACLIADSDPLILYPQKSPPDETALKQQVKEALKALDQEDWQNLSLLSLLLEKFGSYLSFGEPNTALVDVAKITAAIAATLASDLEATHLSLIAGDLSGIQKFIYTISSNGALKSLRARSFYLELVTEEIVQQLLAELSLPRTNVIYAGGGNLYLLAASDGIQEKINKINQKLNKWLRKEFQGKVFLALDYQNFSASDLANQRFVEHWDEVIKKLNQQKTSKFRNQIEDLLQSQKSYEPCRVCHRDDTDNLKELNEPGSVLACPTCRKMFQLGADLFETKVIVRSPQRDLTECPLSFKFPTADNDQHTEQIYYHFFKNWRQVIQNPDTILLINDWTIEHYQFRHFRNVSLLLLGNYAKGTERPGEIGFMPASEMAENAVGIGRVGYLRMDVDRLGQIFAKGLGQSYSLPKLAGLSRQMSYFFKVYLNSLAKNRIANLPDESKCRLSYGVDGEVSACPNLLFIYAGGDDLFISGTWNEVVEFAFDVYQSFRAYTGSNPDITLSGGISITAEKFPLYQAAEESGKAEEAAKGNGRDSLSLFGSAFKWSEWLGTADKSIVESKDAEYWEEATPTPVEPKLLGISPFVFRLRQQQLQPNYSRSFVRNLLIAAQLQEQMIKEIKDKRKQQQYDYEIQDIQYYLHLPQIAYTLARLPKEAFKDKDFRQSLKSPYNAPYFRAIATWIELLTRSQL